MPSDDLPPHAPKDVLTRTVPDDHPAKRSIEDAVREALSAVPGPWRAHLGPARLAPWWVLVIQRPRDGFRTTLLVAPENQDAAAIGQGIGQALRAAEHD